MLPKDITIVIADDHPMLLKGLYDELSSNNYHIVGQANNGMNALELILTEKPQVAILDIDMPLLNGFEVSKMAKEKKIDTKFIILSFHKEVEYITQAKALNINGYLLKEDSFFEVERCIQAVIKGEEYFSKTLDEKTINYSSSELRKLQFLTPSETTILKMIAQDTATEEIADKLNISRRTVEKHRSNIIFKLELKGSTNSLTNWALKNKNFILEI